MTNMPTFQWQTPNVHTAPGAVWLHRKRLPGGEWSEPVARTDIPKQIIRSVGIDSWRRLVSEFRAPASVGDRFYATLRRLGYPLTKRWADETGDYQ